MTNVKKQFEEVYALLEANSNKKVSTILPQLMELMTKKGGNSTFVTNDHGEVVAIYCYYHKKWELVSECEYGAKKNTATGLNTMCKQGVSAWTRQQRIKKQGEAKLLEKVADGSLDPSLIGDRLAELKAEAEVIEPRDDEHGYESSAEAIDAQ